MRCGGGGGVKRISKANKPSKGLVLGAGAVRVYLSKLRLGIL